MELDIYDASIIINTLGLVRDYIESVFATLVNPSLLLRISE